MPAPVIAAIITAAATTGAMVYSVKASGAASKLQSDAAERAARLSASASDRATQAQTTSTDQTLAFQQEQAARDAARQETNRHADYDQWAAREGRIGSIGEILGLPARQIPGYVPQSNGTIAGSQGTGAPGGSAATMPGKGEVDWTAPPDQLASQLSSYYQKRGADPREVPYWVSKAGELIERGRQLNDPGYADKRLAASEVFGGGAAPATTKKSTAPAGSIASIGIQTPAYQAPRVAMPGTIRSLGA